MKILSFSRRRKSGSEWCKAGGLRKHLVDVLLNILYSNCSLNNYHVSFQKSLPRSMKAMFIFLHHARALPLEKFIDTKILAADAKRDTAKYISGRCASDYQKIKRTRSSNRTSHDDK